MSNLEFFKKQAKIFLKDWQTQIKTVESDGFISYHYDWKFYDVGDLFFYYELDDKDEQDIKLARAQHWISKMVGFKKWDELIHASKVELELAEFLLRRFKNAQDVQNWEETIQFAGIAELEPEIKLEYARQYYELGDRAAIVNDLDYKILTPIVMYGQTKIAGLEKGIKALKTDFTMNTKVQCLHCGQEYLYNEATVVKHPDNDELFIMCKHYPECNGSLIDMMEV